MGKEVEESGLRTQGKSETECDREACPVCRMSSPRGESLLCNFFFFKRSPGVGGLPKKERYCQQCRGPLKGGADVAALKHAV